MTVEEVRRKRLLNEQAQDALLLEKRQTERQQDRYQHLFFQEKQLAEGLVEKYYGTRSGAQYEEYIEQVRRDEWQVLETLEEIQEKWQKQERQLEDQNERLYQEELALLKAEEEEWDGQS